MKKTQKTLSIFAALSLLSLLAGCAEQEAQSNDPNAFFKDTIYYSNSNKNESNPNEESSADAVTINGDVMWGMGKTYDEVTEKYGPVTVEDLNNVYMFENGYGKYVFGGRCITIGEIPAKDLLDGDISTVTLDNIAEKCGFNVVPIYDSGDPNTMYEGYRLAYYTHPSYENVYFSMFYKESGFDETASFDVRLNDNKVNIKDEFINTLNSVIDSAADVETLNSGLRNADADGRITEVQAFENPTAFVENTLYPSGELNDGAVVLVELGDGGCYITTRGNRENPIVPKPFEFFSNIAERAGSVDQFKKEFDGYNLGLGDRKAINVTVYQDGAAAAAGDDSGERIIQNGELVGSDDMLKKDGFFRVEYDGGESCMIFVPN